VSGTSGTPTGLVTFYDGASALGAAVNVDATGKATFSTTTTPAGTRSIKAGYSGDTKYATITSAPLTQTVNKAPATATLTLGAIQKQYSDTVLATATVSPIDAAQSVTFKSGTRELGTYNVVAGKAAVNLPLLNVTLGSNLLTAVFNQSVPNYTVPSPGKPLSIASEDATVAYSGPNPETICSSCTTLKLTATVSDISVTNPVGDPDSGDVGNATVSFVNRATGLTIATVKVVATTADPRIGTATFDWPITIAANSTQSYTIGMVVGGYYQRNNTADNVVVKVTKP
jgi:Big-like domain-containing protein